MAKKAEKRPDFVAPSERAKSRVMAQIVRLARKERLDYAEFLLKASPKNQYLFESRRRTPFTRAACSRSCRDTATGQASPNMFTPICSAVRC